MNGRTKLILAAAAASVLALGGAAGLASADGGHGGWGKGHGMRGMMAAHMMERYDADKDGKLSQEEIDRNRTEWHGEFDGDKNASLSLDEFRNLWLKARNERMVREFQHFDRDGNGQVTLEEYKRPLEGLVAEHDRNGDGVLSRDDRQRRGERGHGRGEGKRHGMGQGMGHGMGQGMSGQDEDGTAPAQADTAPAQPETVPEAPANP